MISGQLYVAESLGFNFRRGQKPISLSQRLRYLRIQFRALSNVRPDGKAVKFTKATLNKNFKYIFRK
jgi:hypothetical protein